MPATRRQLLRKSDGMAMRHCRTFDCQRAFARCFSDAVLASPHRTRSGIVRDHGDDGIGIASGIGRRCGPSCVPKELRHRTGYGLDTCHLYASGFDIASSEDGLRSVLDEFESAAGEPPSFFHLNDSEGELGSNRDRHVLLGEGHIGAEPFRWLLRDRRSEAVPLILETPQQNPEPDRDDASADPYDIAMCTLLRGFEAESGGS